VREQIARSHVEIEAARLLCYRASRLIDTVGNKGRP
jgi:alkylation response protein AidB-like acyl-CoA dehydrogenase